MNTRVLQGELMPEDMASIVNDCALKELPTIDALSTREGWQLLTLLGILGTSVERHAQQAVRRHSPAEAVLPGKGLALLFVNGKQPFLEYFQALANTLHHPHRDSFITYIEMNGPCTEVQHPGMRQPMYRLGNLFEDDSFITFTGKFQEVEFITLLKKSVSLQGAANLLIEEAINHPQGFGGFRSHVRDTYHVLLPDAVARLEQAMNRESLEVLISKAIHLDLEALLTLDESQVCALIQKQPWLAACLVLYRSQHEVSKAHFSTIMKYLVWPKRKRDKLEDSREQVTVVSNTRGSTGMEPMGIMAWLDQSRARHPLAMLGHRLPIVQLCSTLLQQYVSHPIEMSFEELVTFLPTDMSDTLRPCALGRWSNRIGVDLVSLVPEAN